MMRSMMGNKATRSQSTAKSPSPDRSDPCSPRAFRHDLVLSRKHDILILAVIFPFGGQEQLPQKQVGAVPPGPEKRPLLGPGPAVRNLVGLIRKASTA